jgi:hypothetical protein
MNYYQNTLCVSASLLLKTPGNKIQAEKKWKPTCPVGRQIETKHLFSNVLQKHRPEKP